MLSGTPVLDKSSIRHALSVIRKSYQVNSSQTKTQVSRFGTISFCEKKFIDFSARKTEWPWKSNLSHISKKQRDSNEESLLESTKLKLQQKLFHVASAFVARGCRQTTFLELLHCICLERRWWYLNNCPWSAGHFVLFTLSQCDCCAESR